MTESTTTLALITIVGSVITALFKLLGDNTKALERVATASENTAKATEKGAVEAEARNGHLAEITTQTHKQTIKAIEKIPTAMKAIAKDQAADIIKAVKVDKLNAKNAHVDTMIVDHQEMK